MDNEESEEHVVTEVTPASSENDLDEKRSEESEEDGDVDEDDDIDKMLDDLASFQEASVYFLIFVGDKRTLNNIDSITFLDVTMFLFGSNQH